MTRGVGIGGGDPCSEIAASAPRLNSAAFAPMDSQVDGSRSANRSAIVAATALATWGRKRRVRWARRRHTAPSNE